MEQDIVLTGLPSVAEVVTMPHLQSGLPEVLIGEATLQAPVRWVHVSDSPRVAALLDGGELLLSTGAGWPGDAAGLSAFASELAAARVAGIVLELGTRFAVAPPAFVDACRRSGVALISLEREVKFVAVTEAVHRRIIAGQLEALQQRQQLHELFTALSLRGAPADVIVRETARALDAGVVLENLAHEVVAADARALDDADLLDGWAARSRRIADGREKGWHLVPVQARGIRWGTLIAAPGASHPAGRTTVLEQAATALALARLADGDGAWELLSQRRLLASLLTQQYATTADVEARLEAGGFPVRGRLLQALATDATSPSAVEDAIAAVSDLAPDARSIGAVIDGGTVILLSLPSEVALPDSFARRIADVFGGEDAGGLAVGLASATVTELLDSLPAVRVLARRVPSGRFRRVEDRPLGRLIASLHGDHRLQEHSERMLEPLIRHDQVSGGDLLDVLGALLRHPGNRTAAAVAAHLSRSVFYQRLTLIGDLLDADLDDGETLAALHLALSAYTASSR
ncbi:MAG TPA: PucR family transcriptional regulator ligand-binding domain-containing protein [Microbacterium sp.]|nr:PucR family transcriptional regulator ligand-binding domain-containing protein [Microbacterium sp.]